jgi:hypothetical protein
MKTYPAQIVFTEQRPGVWRGRLLRRDGVIDTQRHDLPVHGTPRWDIEQGSTCFSVLMQGSRCGGRRYRTFKTLDEAQAAGIRWAGRRFRVPA